LSALVRRPPAPEKACGDCLVPSSAILRTAVQPLGAGKRLDGIGQYPVLRRSLVGMQQAGPLPLLIEQAAQRRRSDHPDAVAVKFNLVNPSRPVKQSRSVSLVTKKTFRTLPKMLSGSTYTKDNGKHALDSLKAYKSANDLSNVVQGCP
jgi:hypothetical protein